MFRQFILPDSEPGKRFWLSVLIAAAVLCLLGPVKVFSDSSIPITLQSLLVVLIPVILGWQAGTLAVLIYLIAGAAGLPVFVGYSHGVDKFIGPTGGFLIGFAAAAVVSGYIAELPWKKWRVKALVALLGGHLIILGLGLPWLWKMMPEEDPLGRILYYFGPMSLIKIALAFLIVQVVGRMIEKRGHSLT